MHNVCALTSMRARQRRSTLARSGEYRRLGCCHRGSPPAPTVPQPESHVAETEALPNGEDERSGSPANLAGEPCGARGGRGFRYQDLVTTAFLAEMHAGVRAQPPLSPKVGMTLRSSVETLTNWHKSRAGNRISGPSRPATWRGTSSMAGNATNLGFVPAESIHARAREPIADAEDIDGPVPGAVADLIRSRGGLAWKLWRTCFNGRACAGLRDPLAHAAQLLAESLGGEPGQYVVHLQALRAAAGEAADANANVSEQTPASVTITDVTRILDDINQTVDRDQLDVVLTSGVCEPIDFLTPLDDPAFYLGVDVVPGHVTAGLVLERPDVLATIDDSLEQRRPVLITGPSGAGKSAAMYLAGYLDRGRRRHRSAGSSHRMSPRSSTSRGAFALHAPPYRLRGRRRRQDRTRRMGRLRH